MIADAPYRTGPLILSPRAGVAAGAVGGLLMMAILSLLGPLSKLQAGDVLQRIGQILPFALVGPRIVGAAIMTTCAMLLGGLYATSQQRAPARGLLAVGLFYGVVLWIVGGLFTRWLIGGELAVVVRSWPWFVADVVYGLWLAQVGIVISRRAPQAVAVPVD